MVEVNPSAPPKPAAPPGRPDRARLKELGLELWRVDEELYEVVRLDTDDTGDWKETSSEVAGRAFPDLVPNGRRGVGSAKSGR